MRSTGNDQFWQLYSRLPKPVRAQARQAYQLFLRDPDHPSLRFKKLHGPRNLWSVRFGGGSRAVGERRGDEIVWLWVGARQDFGQMF